MLKLRIPITFILFLLVPGISTAAEQTQKVTVQVDGLACPFCAYGLEKKLKKIEGVERLEIKMNDGEVILFFKQTARIDKKSIVKKIKETGFSPGEIQVEAQSLQEAKDLSGHKIVLNIKGMSCDGCVSRVDSALSSLDCVQDVKVSLSNEKAEFNCTDKKVNQSKFVQVIEALGFKAELATE
jgi:copper ion binding protein